jgi:hypothetical protein
MITPKTITVKARFDGKVFVPEEPVSLSADTVVELRYRPWPARETDTPPLARLAAIAKTFPPNPDAPHDGAAQHDHYLYGTPKRPNP